MLVPTKLTPWFVPLSAALTCLMISLFDWGDGPAKEASTVPPAQKGPWMAIPDSALQIKAGDGGKTVTVSNGVIAGITVDRTEEGKPGRMWHRFLRRWGRTMLRMPGIRSTTFSARPSTITRP
jgi:hypothetical protein